MDKHSPPPGPDVAGDVADLDAPDMQTSVEIRMVPGDKLPTAPGTGHWSPGDEVADLQRQVTAVMWLKGIAQDQLEHGRCHGCRVNSAQALAELGLLDMMLAHVGVGDPRTLPPELRKTDGGGSWPGVDPLGSR